MLGFNQQALHLSQGVLYFRACALQLGTQIIQGTNALALHALEPLHGGQIRFQALGLDQ
ncbi:hypothetical protein D3C81_1757640 [compost metagenome]